MKGVICSDIVAAPFTSCQSIDRNTITRTILNTAKARQELKKATPKYTKGGGKFKKTGSNKKRRR